MKKLLISFAMLVSGSAFGFFDDASRSYQGGGEWSDSQGHTGVYDVSIRTAHESRDVVRLEETYYYGNEIKRLSLKLVRTGLHSFDVTMEDAVVGGGYCFEGVQKFHTNCHLDYLVGERRGEYSVSLSDISGKLRRYGSCGEGDQRILWTDKLKPRN